ncbi:MAG: restriction endonuclease subunit S [Burkholderiales bacterium]|nr:restriction endonuclease subunit S [Burkholderiales bacterium]MCP5292729.1 restriction endonuclease subunit S [Burkholderiales bacterium]
MAFWNSVKLGDFLTPYRFELSRDNIKTLLLPLPSVEEQQVIVNKVEKLLALCDQLETQITQNQVHAEQLIQAVLKEAFGHNREAALRSV